MVRMQLIFGLLICTMVGPAEAGGLKCDVDHVSLPYDVYDTVGKYQTSADFEMTLNTRTCEVNHVLTPQYACSFAIGLSHYSRGVRCGSSLSGSWMIRAADDPRSYFNTKGEGVTAVVPSSAELKKLYSHLDDDDAAKPVDKDNFPKNFTEVGEFIKIDNPDFVTNMQVVRYLTMHDELRVGISANAEVGCFKYQFGFIFTNDEIRGTSGEQKLATSEKDIASFVGSLRLEHVDEPLEKFKNYRTEILKQALLKKVIECTPH